MDNIRLSTAKEAAAEDDHQVPGLGTDLVVSGVRELGKSSRTAGPSPKRKRWSESKANCERYDELKRTHPRAVLAVLRDGEKGYDPAHPDKVYAGWKDAYWSSHGPDGMTVERADNTGKEAGHEIFMRHRSPLMHSGPGEHPERLGSSRPG